MRKLFGLLAALFMLMGMNASGASAQEAPPEEQFPVDCTLLNFTPPPYVDVENGNHIVGEPASLELVVPKGGEMLSYFLASFNGGEEFRLQEESSTTIEWRPEEVGEYVIRGEFTDTEGNPLEVSDPAACTIVLTVQESRPAEVPVESPGPVANPGPVPAPQVPVVEAANQSELPRTGNNLNLALVGTALVLVGFGVEWGGRRRKAALS